MKKTILMMMVLSLIITPVFAGLVADPGMDTDVVWVKDLGNFDSYYVPAEYVSGMWVVIDTNSAFHNIAGGNPGQCVRIQSAALRGLGSVTDNGASSTGNLWMYTVDLQNANSGVDASSTVKLVVQGLSEPWNTTGWKNRIDTTNWNFDDGTGVELLNVDIDPTTIGSDWTTYTGIIDLSAGYQYLAVILKANDVGTWNASLNVDNLDIIAIPEPAFLGFIGLGVIAFIRRK